MAPKWIEEYKCDGQGGFSPKLAKKKNTTHKYVCIYTHQLFYVSV